MQYGCSLEAVDSFLSWLSHWHM